jgi:hypothetical protein
VSVGVEELDQDELTAKKSPSREREAFPFHLPQPDPYGIKRS